MRRRRAQSAGPGGGAQVLRGGAGMAGAGGASIVPAGCAPPAAAGSQGALRSAPASSPPG